MGGGSLFHVGEDVEFWRVLIYLSILAFCLVLLEGALHKLEHKFPPSEKYQHMLKKAYRELMVLGLISLGLKILKEIPDIDSYSKTMLAFQVADLTIFLLALALILQSTGVFLLLRNQNDRAERAELITTQDLVNSVNGSNGSDDATGMPTFFQTLFCCGRSAKKRANDRELVELRLLRRLFLRRFGLPQLFPYSKYLNRAQANQIAHMIEVEPGMWIVLLIVAWAICGLLEILESLHTNIPESHDLVEAVMVFAWITLLLHYIVCLCFRSCVRHLLYIGSFSTDKCAVYELDDIYEEFGVLPAVIVPLALLINALILQHCMFYDFVIVSSMLRIDSHTLSDVVENFSEVVRLRSEFATTLLNHIIQQELDISDFQEELKSRDRTSSGFIEVDELREVLAKFGFRLTRYRFNSVVKMLFELKGTTVSHSHVVHLMLMAQTENVYEAMSSRQRLRQSTMMNDDLSLRSLSTYGIFTSTRQVAVMLSPNMDEPSPSDFVSVDTGNTIPKTSQCGANGNLPQTMTRPCVSSQALHDMFHLSRVSESNGFNRDKSNPMTTHCVGSL